MLCFPVIRIVVRASDFGFLPLAPHYNEHESQCRDSAPSHPSGDFAARDIMNGDWFQQRVKVVTERLTSLQQHADGKASPLRETLADLCSTIEQLHVADEELRV